MIFTAHQHIETAQEFYRDIKNRARGLGRNPDHILIMPGVSPFVGRTEEEAREAGHDVVIFESRFRPMKLTLTECQEKTLMKLVVDGKTDKVLGCHMVGPDAGEIVQGLAIALKAGATKRDFDDTIGVHPTAAEEFVTMRTPVGA